MELEVGKCYVELDKDGKHLISIVKIHPSDSPRFSNFIMEESLLLTNNRFEGERHKSYRSKGCFKEQYIEVPEEEFQKFNHLREVYDKAVEGAKNKLTQKLNLL